MTTDYAVVCLRWGNHRSHVTSVIKSLLDDQSLVDVTLAADGQLLKAHKIVLCAYSSHFEQLFSSHPDKYPIIFMKDVKFSVLKILVDFMYKGEVCVREDELTLLIQTAERLKIKGLALFSNKSG